MIASRLSQTRQEAVIAPRRRMGPLVMHCVMEEGHTDDLEITEHPVEMGASINDHAFKRPATLTLRGGWSNSSQLAGGNENYVREMYAALLELQEAREPFDVVTGKRAYKNMLLQSVSMTTDETTEHALVVSCELKQVNIVETMETGIPPRANHRNPGATGGTGERGGKQAEESNRSILRDIYGVIFGEE